MPPKTKESPPAKEWTRFYYGVSHYGKLADFRRSTVVMCGGKFILSLWERGCGFYPGPEKRLFSDLETARKTGERWANSKFN